MKRSVGIGAFLAYTGSIFGANWAIQRFGLTPVGFGLLAPAGVWFAGATFVARDVVQMALGKRIVIMAILLGAALSAFISASLAVASGLAFLLGELADYFIYSPLAGRGRVVAGVLLADSVGLVVDSFAFLLLAGLPASLWLGLSVGKEWMTLLVLPIVWASRRRLRDWTVA